MIFAFFLTITFPRSRNTQKNETLNKAAGVHRTLQHTAICRMI